MRERKQRQGLLANIKSIFNRQEWLVALSTDVQIPIAVDLNM